MYSLNTVQVFVYSVSTTRNCTYVYCYRGGGRSHVRIDLDPVEREIPEHICPGPTNTARLVPMTRLSATCGLPVAALHLRVHGYSSKLVYSSHNENINSSINFKQTVNSSTVLSSLYLYKYTKFWPNKGNGE